VNRILLVRLGALGDIVHAIPVAAALRRSFPQARIDWLVSAKHREILDLVPVIDRRLVVNDRGDSPGGASLASAIRELRRQHYDAAIDMQGLIKSALISRASGARKIIGFSRKYVREGLASFFYTSVHNPGGAGIYARSETRHVVEINLGLLEPLGIKTIRPEFPFNQTASTVADQMSTAAGGPFALLNPGAAWPNKRWAPQRLAALADALRDRHGLMSVVLWGPGEREIGETVVAHARDSALLSPRTAIADVVALARRALVMVSGDTGPTHIAAAVGTPIVGIYGPTRPERNGPWQREDVTVSRADACQCHHLRRCARERMCLMDIEVDEVLAAVERRLASARRG
jgi:lipopolysaccharide heptosyltransferase I